MPTAVSPSAAIGCTTVAKLREAYDQAAAASPDPDPEPDSEPDSELEADSGPEPGPGPPATPGNAVAIRPSAEPRPRLHSSYGVNALPVHEPVRS
jgi:hypothetical protein